MHLLSSLPRTVLAIALSTHLAGGTVHAITGSLAAAATTRVTDGANTACPPTREASIAIPFERVDLGSAATRAADDSYLLGPRMLAVVGDSAEWPAIWHAAVVPSIAPARQTADSIPVPRVSFANDVLVLVATRTHGGGPVRLRVTSIRQCLRNGIVIVSTMQTSPGTAATTMLSRGFDVVRVHGRALATNAVIFEDGFQRQPR